jgi:saccharopine dehydrogenase-like NADP-dependent oxidoreductase
MKDKILVIGGYGQVGQVICKELGEKFPGQVIAAGRTYEKARKFSETTKGQVRPLEFDVTKKHKQSEMLAEVDTVVMCIDQDNTQFVETCFKKGIHYVDITADYNLLTEIKSLHSMAGNSGVTGLLSVGLSPGLTNLLVKYSKSYFDRLDRADISVMLGVRDKHGRAAIEWMLDNLNITFEVRENDEVKQVRSFTEGRETTFSPELGARTAYRFNFP